MQHKSSILISKSGGCCFCRLHNFAIGSKKLAVGEVSGSDGRARAPRCSPPAPRYSGPPKEEKCLTVKKMNWTPVLRLRSYLVNALTLRLSLMYFQLITSIFLPQCRVRGLNLCLYVCLGRNRSNYLTIIVTDVAVSGVQAGPGERPAATSGAVATLFSSSLLGF